jgi:sec-independent protein translocase protein TatC
MLDKLRNLKARFRYNDEEMPFLEHLEEFRKMVIRSVVTLLVCTLLVALFFVPTLVGVLRAPAEPYIVKSAEEVIQQTEFEVIIPVSLQDDGTVIMGSSQAALSNAVREIEGNYYLHAPISKLQPKEQTAQRGTIRLQFSEPAGAIKMWLMVAFFGGLLIGLPFLVFIIGSFVMPGIKDLERQVMTRISGFAGLLFILGIFMGYKVTLPLALGIMLDIGGRLGGESIWFYGKYIAFAIQLLIGFGVAFQLPVVILILGRMGLVNSTQLREKRPHVVVGLFILSMVLTPPDVMTQVLMAAPLILLYEFCIWFLHFSGNRGVATDKEVQPQDDTAKDETTKEKR